MRKHDPAAPILPATFSTDCYSTVDFRKGYDAAWETDTFRGGKCSI
jgi:hypothetical protein